MESTVHAVKLGRPSIYQSWIVRGRNEGDLKVKTAAKVAWLSERGWSIWQISWGQKEGR